MSCAFHRIDAGSGDQTHRNWLGTALDDENVAHFIVMHHVWSGVFVLAVDTIDVTAGRFGDVRISRDDRFEHESSVCGVRRSMLAAPKG